MVDDMIDTKRHYRAFLLRLWRERSDGQWVWRASLENPHDHSRWGFPDLERLHAYLQEITKDDPVEDS